MLSGGWLTCSLQSRRGTWVDPARSAVRLEGVGCAVAAVPLRPAAILTAPGWSRSSGLHVLPAFGKRQLATLTCIRSSLSQPYVSKNPEPA